MIIYSHNGSPLLNVNVDDSSYRYEEIMGDSTVNLEFSLTEHVEIDPGSYVLYKGTKYELMSRESVTIQHTRNYEYKATFSGPQARFSRYVMYNNQDGRLKFDMIAQPITLLTMVIWNLNNREPGTWAIGDYVEKEERLVSFNHTSVRDALNAIASAFDTEWSITPDGGGYVINLRKVEYNKDYPLALRYGKNQGFKPGVGRVNYGDYGQVEKVWIDGGERNLSIGEYGYTTLHFPRGLSFSMDKNGNYRYTYEGQTYTQSEYGTYDEGSSLSFVTDEWGASVRLASAASNCVEVSLDLTEYYPKRVGKTTDVFYLYKGEYLTYSALIAAYPDVDWSEVQIDIVDSTLDDDSISGSENGLDYSKYLFSNDDPLTVIFQNGNLSGREFNATFVKEAKTRTVVNEQTGEEEEIIIRPANRFELERNTIDGVDMPNAIFRPNASSAQSQDEFIVTNCYLPDEYICNFPAFEGAELDALREACKFIRDNKDPQFTFKGEVDGLYAKRNWDAIGGKLILGGCISFQNDNIQPTPIVTRIVGIKEYVNNPYSPELTMSNETVKGGMSSMMAQLKAADEHVIERVNEARRFSRRSFRDAKETIAMLAGALDYFSEGINPITVETMSLLVGDESLQFQFWYDRDCTRRVVNPVVYDEDEYKVRIPECVIQHMTLGIADVKPSESRNADEYLRWSMEPFNSAPLRGDNEDGSSVSETAYYVYAKVDAENVAKPDEQRTTEELTHIGGEFLLSKTKLPFRTWDEGSSESEEEESEEGEETEGRYYHLLVGILNSEYEGSRSFAPMYGFTEVLPGQITTDVIRSANGDSFFDLVNNQFALGDSLTFINNELKLSGAFVQKGDGTYTNIGSWCGQWTTGVQYALGDEVWWQASNGVISSYRYIYPNPTTASASNDPSHSNYWQVFAQGIPGASGQSSFKSTIFCRTNETPIAPGSNVGYFQQPNPPSETSWQVFKEGNTPISGVYWSDGIPAGGEILWATTRIFTSDGSSPQQLNWSTPRQMTDTDTFDVEFAYIQTNDADPATPTDANRHGGSGTQVWFDPVLDPTADWTEMFWRAERECVNGEWGDWVIVRIKGEKGEDGNGIDRVEVYYNITTDSSNPPSSWPYAEGVRPSQSGESGKYFWTKTVIKYTDTSKADKVTYTAQYIPGNGAAGENGPMLVYRGQFDMNEFGEYDLDQYGNTVHQTYYGNDKRRDVIWFENKWWMTLDVREETQTSDGEFSGIDPDSAQARAYWSSFEGNFANIATGLAYIDRLYVKNFNTAGVGEHSSKRIVAEQNAITMYDDNNQPHLTISGDDITAAGTSETIQMSAKPSLISVSITFPTDTIRHSSYVATGDTYLTNVTVLGTASVKVNSRSVGFTVGAGLASGRVQFEVRNYIVIDDTKTLLNSYATGVTNSVSSRTFSMNYPERTFTLGSGTHTIYHTTEVIATGPDATPTTNGTLTISAGVSSSGTIVVSYPTLKTEIGANGFRVMLSSDKMAQFTVENNTANLLIRSSDYGIWISDGFMKLMLGTANEWKTVYNDGGYLKLL